MKNKTKKKRSLAKSTNLYYHKHRRTGLIGFIGKNVIKLLIILVLIIALILGVNQLLIYFDINIKDWFTHYIEYVNHWYVLAIFFLSESVLGWIPPDLFIIWGKSALTDMPYLNVGILATISYLGGIVAYWLGTLIRRFPRVNAYVKRRFENNFQLIDRWGGVIVVLAAMFPLPYATISTVAGVVHYPFKKFLIYGSTRYIRFYLYAAWIFWGLKQIA